MKKLACISFVHLSKTLAIEVFAVSIDDFHGNMDPSVFAICVTTWVNNVDGDESFLFLLVLLWVCNNVSSRATRSDTA
jgi:hypothetical protein